MYLICVRYRTPLDYCYYYIVFFFGGFIIIFVRCYRFFFLHLLNINVYYKGICVLYIVHSIDILIKVHCVTIKIDAIFFPFNSAHKLVAILPTEIVVIVNCCVKTSELYRFLFWFLIDVRIAVYVYTNVVY